MVYSKPQRITELKGEICEHSYELYPICLMAASRHLLSEDHWTNVKVGYGLKRLFRPIWGDI